VSAAVYIDTCSTIHASGTVWDPISYFCALQAVFSALGFENNTIIIQNIIVLMYLHDSSRQPYEFIGKSILYFCDFRFFFCIFRYYNLDKTKSTATDYLYVDA
jgi:hypothetical protein